MAAKPIDAETIRLLVRLQGLAVPEEDLEPLGVALGGQLEAGARILERYGSSSAEPPVVFDARWE